jgi:hypothetical protein
MDSIFPIRGMSLDVDQTSGIDLSVKDKSLHLNYLRGMPAVFLCDTVALCTD